MHNLYEAIKKVAVMPTSLKMTITLYYLIKLNTTGYPSNVSGSWSGIIASAIPFITLCVNKMFELDALFITFT